VRRTVEFEQFSEIHLSAPLSILFYHINQPTNTVTELFCLHGFEDSRIETFPTLAVVTGELTLHITTVAPGSTLEHYWLERLLLLYLALRKHGAVKQSPE
jgi:hypothetical protein